MCPSDPGREDGAWPLTPPAPADPTARPDAGAVLYASDQIHSWIGRAAGLLGLQPAQVRLLPSDHEFRLPAAQVAAAVAADRAAGRRPFCLVATSGTTSTGSVDPLAELAALCRPRASGSTSTARSAPRPS